MFSIHSLVTPLRQHDRLLVLGVVERERVEGLRGALRGVPEVLRQVEREVQDLGRSDA